MNKALHTLAALALVALASCSGSGNRSFDTEDIEDNPATIDNPAVPAGPRGHASFEDTAFYFGQINDGEKVQHVYKFKNTGDGPMSIANVQASCGCTTPNWTKDLIPPGGEGSITATFDSNGKGGTDNPLVEKSINVVFDNADNNFETLLFRAHILATEDHDDFH